MSRLLGAFVLASTIGPRLVAADNVTEVQVTEAEVQKAQKTWGDGIVDIGRIETEGGDFVARAGQLVDSLYALGIVDVLFKPTMAEMKPFRTTREGTLSYFVANAPDTFPEDVTHGGFARHPWQAVRFEVAGSWYGPGTALSMGHYIFTDMSGTEHTAEFSFAYVRDEDGGLRIALHHSSFPFCGEEFVSSHECMLSSKTDLAAGLRSLLPALHQQRSKTAAVTTDAVTDAEQMWGDGVVDLGAASATDVHSKAVDFVSARYAYSSSPSSPWTGPGTLFKPTKARVTPFRTTLDGGVSYFVGGDVNFAEDHGFALQPWTDVRFEAAGTTQLSPSLAVTMGHYFFTDTDSKEHKAEFSLAYLSADGDDSTPLIALHHSSFPFCFDCGPDQKTPSGSSGSGHGATTDFSVPTPIFAAAGFVLILGIVVFSWRKQQVTARDRIFHGNAEALIPRDSVL